MFTSGEHFSTMEVRRTGELTESGISCEVKQVSDGVITLKMPTFTAIAEKAGVSRVIMGGYRIRADNVAKLHVGRKVAG